MSLEAGAMLPDMLSTGFMGAENAHIGIGPVGLSAVAGARINNTAEFSDRRLLTIWLSLIRYSTFVPSCPSLNARVWERRTHRTFPRYASPW